MAYSHRNGETELPTKPGWYWVKVHQSKYPIWSGLDMRYVDRLYHDERLAYRMDSIGSEPIADIGETLKWWGPVTPPWE